MTAAPAEAGSDWLPSAAGCLIVLAGRRNTIGIEPVFAEGPLAKALGKGELAASRIGAES